MLVLNLLTIQLFPDYAIVAAIVIAAHWIWIFGFRKRGLQKTTNLKDGYQTGGNLGSLSPEYNTQQDDSIIPKPVLPKNIFGSNFNNINNGSTAATSAEEPEINHPVEENNLYISYELTQSQAEFDLSPALIKLSEGNIPDDELETLHEIAIITVAADTQYPQTIEVVQDMLGSDTGDHKDLPIIH